MSVLSDDEIDRLLSRGGLGREHKRRVLRDVLGSVHASPVPRRRLRWRWPAFAAVSLSGALAVTAFWPRASGTAETTVREKGALADAPIIAMSCLGGSLTACPTGSRIAFWLEGGRKQPGFLTAYADSIASGERVWLVTNEVVPRAALVGREQPRGRYRVKVILTRRPVDRAELVRLTPDVIVTRATFDLVIGSP